jgi:hypothetical protein
VITPRTDWGSIGGGDAAPERADGNHPLPGLPADEPGDVRSRKLGVVRVRLLEQLLAARRSTAELDAALAELGARRPRHRYLW